MDDALRRVTALEGEMKDVKSILGRMEPVLARIDVITQNNALNIAKLDGRMTGIEEQIRQIPTIWTISGLVFAIFAAAFTLLRFGVPRL